MTRAERDYLFPASRSFLNFDVRPLPELDLVMDIQDMHVIETASISACVALHVLNHVPNDLKAIGEVARVLKPNGGVFLATVPAIRGSATRELADITRHYGEDALRLYGVGSYRQYGVNDLLQHLRLNFEPEVFEYKDTYRDGTEFLFSAIRRDQPSLSVSN
jgi:SAM-dependent methyltransferase